MLRLETSSNVRANLVRHGQSWLYGTTPGYLSRVQEKPKSVAKPESANLRPSHIQRTQTSAISAQTTRSGRLSAGEMSEASERSSLRGGRRREAGDQPECKRGAPQALHSRLRQNLKKRLLGHPCVLLGDISILIPSLLWRGPPHLPVLPCIACLVREGLIEASI